MTSTPLPERQQISAELASMRGRLDEHARRQFDDEFRLPEIYSILARAALADVRVVSTAWASELGDEDLFLLSDVLGRETANLLTPSTETLPPVGALELLADAAIRAKDQATRASAADLLEIIIRILKELASQAVPA